MKKILVAAAAAATLLFSCGKEDPATGISVEQAFQSKATIEGVAHVNANTTGTTVENFAPAGTILIVTVDNREYGNSSTLNNDGKYVTTAIVGENGAFSVSVPAREDGAAVEVKINADPILVNVKLDNKEELQIFTVTEQTISVQKGLTYQKRIDYTIDANLIESADWKTGSYQVALKYNNGKELVAVPAGTEVKITIDKDEFFPARTNNLTFISVVKAGGLLELNLAAPTLLESGLPFSMESVFVADFITIEAGREKTQKFEFKMPTPTERTINGDVPKVDTDIVFGKGNPTEQIAADAQWGDASFNVTFFYDKTPSLADIDNYITIPEDARLTITEKRSAVNPSLSDVVKTMTYAEFAALTDGYATTAPDPALSNSSLIVEIKVNFITSRRTSANNVTPAINDSYKFNYQTSFSLRAGIPTVVGRVTQPETGVEVKNAKFISNASAENLTNN